MEELEHIVNTEFTKHEKTRIQLTNKITRNVTEVIIYVCVCVSVCVCVCVCVCDVYIWVCLCVWFFQY